VPEGTRIVEHGDAATSAYFVLDGSTTAGVPVEDGYRGLSTMAAGDFFGEIAALTGSLRTADVVADVDTTLLEVPAEALRATMVVPEIQRVVLATMTSRLQRTEAADLPRLAAIDQADLRDLRTPRPQVEALPRTYDQHGGVA
jgi:CRP-like cAMP-binding protein